MNINFDALRESGAYSGPMTNALATQNRNRPASSLDPASAGIMREFDAFRERYPDNPELRRISNQLASGVQLNDNVLSTTMARIAENAAAGPVQNQPRNPIASGVGRTADYSGANLTGNDKVDNRTRRLMDLGLSPSAASSANEVLIREAAIPFEEGGGLQAPKGAGPGLFGTALGVLGGLGTLGLGLPAGLGIAGNLFSMGSAANRGDPIGAFGGLAGAGIADMGGINALRNGGGYTNPSGLGLSGENLSLPGLANAPGASPVGGYGAGGLGLQGSNLGLNFASLPGAFNATPVRGYGADALGLDPAQLYNPESMGGQNRGGRSGLPEAPGMGAQGPSAGAGGGQGDQQGSGLTGSATAPQRTASTPGAPGGQTFDATLMAAAGKMPANALAANAMDSGALGLTDRDRYRNPGYQPRPVANFLRI